MILTPWAMGLTAGSAIMIWLLFRAAWPGIVLLLKKGQPDSRFYLYTEKQEVLSNILIRMVFVYFLFSPVFLTMAAFDFSRQIPGAMCPTGVFNANGFGFPLLVIRLLGLFPFISWLVLYGIDQQTTALPFRSVRRVLVGILFLWALADTYMQTAFFLNLNTQVSTSCCAVLFDASQGSAPLSMNLFSRFPSMPAFFISATVYLVIGGTGLWSGSSRLLSAYGLPAPLFFFLALAAMTSRISPYIYALPHHHCPFCILSGKEALIGVPLTLLLFIGSLMGWAAWMRHQALQAMHSDPKINTWFIISVVANLFFIGGSAAVIVLYQLFGQLL